MIPSKTIASNDRTTTCLNQNTDTKDMLFIIDDTSVK